MTAQNKVTSVSSTASEAKVNSTTNIKQLKTTSLSDTVKATQNTQTHTTTSAFISTNRETGTVSTAVSTVPNEDFENEGSIIMKKFAAALAAFTAISSSATSLAQAASYEPEISPTAVSVKKFIDEYNVDLDLNSDGTFRLITSDEVENYYSMTITPKAINQTKTTTI